MKLHMSIPDEKHPSDSLEQRDAERDILEALEKRLGIRLNMKVDIDQRVALDGFADGAVPVCVEVWAHQGPAKGGQVHKVMRDFCKLLLVEKLLGKRCHKVFAVCDDESLAFLNRSWQGRFAKEFDIETVVLDVCDTTRARVLEAQKRQFR
jgi:hypothetical protein